MGGIFTEVDDGSSCRKGHDGRYNDDCPPGKTGVTSAQEVKEGEEERSHDEWCSAPAHATPTGDEAVDRTHNLFREHARGPALAGDVGGSSKSNDETDADAEINIQVESVD